jgi:2-iminobutanoate/2-iminopropanoate deaminase
MRQKIIASVSAPRAIGPYSQAVLAGEFLFLSGQIALDPATGSMIEGDIRVQTERVMQNLGAILRAAGLGFENVVKCTIYLADLGDFATVNDVCGRFFPKDPPARATVQVAALPKGARIEIDAVAIRG